MNFDAAHMEMIEVEPVDAVGNVGFADGKKGRAYLGANGAYLKTSIAMNEIKSSKEFSAVFWYKLNASPDRAGIITIAADDPNNEASDKKNNRNFGFRFFREGSATEQKLNLNIENGSADSWFNSIVLKTAEHSDWQHIAFTISETECKLYLNGNVVHQGAFTGVDWSGCETISIGSGAPYFTEWNHLSDLSLIDELRFFNKTLSKEQIQGVMNN